MPLGRSALRLEHTTFDGTMKLASHMDRTSRVGLHREFASVLYLHNYLYVYFNIQLHIYEYIVLYLVYRYMYSIVIFILLFI